jgi:preprotein translocase subunit SecG
LGLEPKIERGKCCSVDSGKHDNRTGETELIFSNIENQVLHNIDLYNLEFSSGYKAKETLTIALGVVCGIFFLLLLVQYWITSDEEKKKRDEEDKNEAEAANKAEKAEDEIEEEEERERTPMEKEHELYKNLGLVDETAEEKQRRKERQRRKKEAKKAAKKTKENSEGKM